MAHSSFHNLPSALKDRFLQDEMDAIAMRPDADKATLISHLAHSPSLQELMRSSDTRWEDFLTGAHTALSPSSDFHPDNLTNEVRERILAELNAYVDHLYVTQPAIAADLPREQLAFVVERVMEWHERVGEAPVIHFSAGRRSGDQITPLQAGHPLFDELRKMKDLLFLHFELPEYLPYRGAAAYQ